jgi:hypothetical protein
MMRTFVTAADAGQCDTGAAGTWTPEVGSRR